MIEANLAQQSRQFEERMMLHAQKLVATHFAQRKASNENMWRNPHLLWPNFTQD
ncbi:hypothetical protein ACRAQ6_05150 [Erythrobacter sp. HA6-11]